MSTPNIDLQMSDELTQKLKDFGWSRLGTYSKKPANLSPLLFMAMQLSLYSEKSVRTQKVKEVKEVMDLLVEAGADINEVDENGQSLLMFTDTSGVDYLLKKGADPNLQDSFGKTALMYFSEDPCIKKIMVLLLKAGAKIDVKDMEGYTVWDYANEKNFEVLTQWQSQQSKTSLSQELPPSSDVVQKPIFRL